MPAGSVAFVLHAHLPFVRHPAHEDFLEERWLAEAITETYIPLLELLDSLDRDARRSPPARALPSPPRSPRRARRERGAPDASRSDVPSRRRDVPRALPP